MSSVVPLWKVKREWTLMDFVLCLCSLTQVHIIFRYYVTKQFRMRSELINVCLQMMKSNETENILFWFSHHTRMKNRNKKNCICESSIMKCAMQYIKRRKRSRWTRLVTLFTISFIHNKILSVTWVEGKFGVQLLIIFQNAHGTENERFIIF